MKTFFSIAILLTIFSLSHAQEGDDWINRINYNTTTDCPDSVNCYTEVFVDVNMKVVFDSAQICLKIGSTFGASDIYGKCFLNAPSLDAEAEVVRGEDGNIQVNLGRYLIGNDFFVDMIIE